MSLKIAPSILAADLSCLGDEIKRAVDGGCDALHLDIMDGHFVPNLSFGPSIVETVRRLTDLPLDVHLMLDNPLDMIGAFADAGSDYITIHVEAVTDVPEALEAIHSKGVSPGLSLSPGTPVDAVMDYLGMVELLLVMSVNPGYGGQKLIEASYDRISRIAEKAAVTNPELILSVDGGVIMENARPLVNAGANFLVAGTSIFADHGACENVKRMRAIIDAHDL